MTKQLVLDRLPTGVLFLLKLIVICVVSFMTALAYYALAATVIGGFVAIISWSKDLFFNTLCVWRSVDCYDYAVIGRVVYGVVAGACGIVTGFNIEDKLFSDDEEATDEREKE